MDRYVLCRPQGGLTDMLNQVEKCCRYADAFGRTVIVETDNRLSRHFRVAFSRFFVTRQANLLLSNPFSEEELDRADVVPRFLKGRVSTYQSRWVEERLAMCELQTGQPVSFDFEKDHPQPLLIHGQCGGGPDSVFALLRIRLHDVVTDALVKRLKAIPRGYHAIHIRNTDMATDYRPALAELRERNIPHLFLATDNAEVLAVAREMLTGTTVHSFSQLPDNGGQPLHYNPPANVAAVRNADSILDLVMLALARELTLVKVSNNKYDEYSGFSRFAYALKTNKPVLKSFLDRVDVWRQVDGD